MLTCDFILSRDMYKGKLCNKMVTICTNFGLRFSMQLKVFHLVLARTLWKGSIFTFVFLTNLIYFPTIMLFKWTVCCRNSKESSEHWDLYLGNCCRLFLHTFPNQSSILHVWELRRWALGRTQGRNFLLFLQPWSTHQRTCWQQCR